MAMSLAFNLKRASIGAALGGFLVSRFVKSRAIDSTALRKGRAGV